MPTKTSSEPALSKDEVKKIGHLAKLPLTDDEIERLRGELSSTIEYVQILESVPTDKTALPPQLINLENVYREDVVQPSLSQEQALSNAKRTHNGYIVIDAVFEEE